MTSTFRVIYKKEANIKYHNNIFVEFQKNGSKFVWKISNSHTYILHLSLKSVSPCHNSKGFIKERNIYLHGFLGNPWHGTTWHTILSIRFFEIYCGCCWHDPLCKSDFWISFSNYCRLVLTIWFGAMYWKPASPPIDAVSIEILK